MWCCDGNNTVKCGDMVTCCVRATYTVSQKSISGTNISDTTCHQITIQFSTLPNVCFCTT